LKSDKIKNGYALEYAELIESKDNSRKSYTDFLSEKYA
jgi:hypothetical protein